MATARFAPSRYDASSLLCSGPLEGAAWFQVLEKSSPHLLLHPLREQKEWLSIGPDGFHGVLVNATTGRHAPAASSPAPPPLTARSTGSSLPRCAVSH